MAGSYDSPFYALWVQQTNENPTAARRPFAVRFQMKEPPIILCILIIHEIQPNWECGGRLIFEHN